MATSIEMEGNSVEEAITAALEELGVERDQAVIEVLEEESKSFFRRNAGKARVRVTTTEDGTEKAIAMVQAIMRQSHIEGEIHVVETDESVTLNISGKNLGILIGKRGETLSAIQTIANVIQKKTGSDKKIIIDIEGYRQRKIDSLIAMAKRSAERVQRTGKPVSLRPMNSYDRRMIHVALQDHEDVFTVSEGEEPERYLKINPR